MSRKVPVALKFPLVAYAGAFGHDTVIQALGSPLQAETLELGVAPDSGRRSINIQFNPVTLNATPLEVEVEVAVAPGEWVSLGVFDLT